MEVLKAAELAAKISEAIKQPQFPRLAAIEYDLLMQHMRDLYLELANLKTTSKDTASPHYQQPEELLVKRTFKANDKLLLAEAITVKEASLNEKPTEEKPVTIAVEEKPVVTQKDYPATVSTAKVSSLNESIHNTGSLNEKLKSHGKEIHRAISPKQLKDMIDLNKRFVFVNELFKGNKDAFTFAVQHIDELNDMAAATTFIHSQLIATHKWDENSAPVKSFMELVYQRFGAE